MIREDYPRARAPGTVRNGPERLEHSIRRKVIHSLKRREPAPYAGDSEDP